MSFEITERWLMDSGGWQAMKLARTAWQAGAVLTVEFDGTRLRGQVRSGTRAFAAGMLIKSKTDVTNLCSCPTSRREGALCEHSLALGLAWVHRKTSPASAAKSSGSGVLRKEAVPAARPAAPVVSTSGPLAVAFPPNFFEGLLRERLSCSLRVLPAGNGVEETAADRAVHRWLAEQRLTRVPPQVALAGKDAINELLFALREHPRVTVGGSSVAVPAEPPRLPVQVAGRSDRAGAPVRLRLDPQAVGRARWWMAGEWVWGWGGALPGLTGLRVPEEVRALFTEDGLEVDLAWLARRGALLAELFAIDDSAPEWPRLRLVTRQPRFRLALDGGLQQVTAQLFVAYTPGAEFVLPLSEKEAEAFPLPDPEKAGVFVTREATAEAAALARLQRVGFEAGFEAGRLSLRGQTAVLDFYADTLPALEEMWQVELSPRLRSALRQVVRLTPSFQHVAHGEGWLSFGLALEGEAKGSAPWQEARRWLATGRHQRRLPDGRVVVLAKEQFEDLEEVLRDIQPEQRDGVFRIKASQAGYLEASFPQIKTRLAPPAPEPPAPLPPAWEKILRSYQRAGAQWMNQRVAEGLGGILADEMGLGKTVQTLAVISARRAAAQRKETAAPCLVVAPTSLLGNWAAEAARFAPELRVLVVRSGERSRELEALAQGAADLVITSYALLTRDVKHYAAREFDVIFLDEAGYVRNPATQISKAVRRLRARARFALTGTPIENSVRDLWAIMEFVLPGYLGPQTDFRERYEAPLQAGAAAGQVLARLRRRMAPYWLRRLKQEVAAELPSKIEKIIPCELTALQREVYVAIQREGSRKVDEARRSQTAAQTRLTLLTALLRLRQTCGDPRLLDAKEFADRSPEELSGKWAVLQELLEEIRDGGHHVLIFSQFAAQLRLLREAVTQAGLDYCYLDGASRDREAQITAFQNDPAKRVFLISLKAGGYGLNLTKADTVIHFDPWWNPAVENQATDRAHRIGQTRPVTVYKLIAAGTVEEKILALQRQKQSLLEAALDDSTPLMDRGLSDEELEALIR